uniref:Ig-like domain-containing protein n=1 Tax=Cyprinus carpio TaxID=7962 RepID=A0A8C1SSY5_CYPCA
MKILLVFSLCLLVMHGVCGDTDVIKSVSVTEGDSVTLHTNVTEIQSDDQIVWMFGSQDTRIAEIHRQKISTYDCKGTFEDILQMDSQTGSMTIGNVRTEHTELYKVQIITNEATSCKTIELTVYARLPVPVITSNPSNCSSSSSSSSSSSGSSVSRCVLLCSAVNVSAVTLSWYKGNSLLSSISVSDLSISLSLPLEVEYQEKNTYSCVINNPIRNQTTHLDITQLCHTCAELMQQSQSVVLSVIVIVLLLAVVVGVIYLYHKKFKQPRSGVQTCEEEVLYAETRFCARSVHSTKPDEGHHIIYSSVNTK